MGALIKSLQENIFHEKVCFSIYENSEGADQPFHYLDDIKYLVSISKI